MRGGVREAGGLEGGRRGQGGPQDRLGDQGSHRSGRHRGLGGSRRCVASSLSCTARRQNSGELRAIGGSDTQTRSCSNGCLALMSRKSGCREWALRSWRPLVGVVPAAAESRRSGVSAADRQQGAAETSAVCPEWQPPRDAPTDDTGLAANANSSRRCRRLGPGQGSGAGAAYRWCRTR